MSGMTPIMLELNTPEEQDIPEQKKRVKEPCSLSRNISALLWYTTRLNNKYQ
jgi:hypothetical protein